MTNYLLAGGGTAGHVNPLLALADAIRADSSSAKVFALGTAEGLEQQLVPARGYALLTIARLPFPRKLNAYVFRFPFEFFKAVKQCQDLISKNQIDVLVGFGGYASAPAYVAARRLGVPLVVHEANALPGWANKLGNKFASATGVAFRGTPLKNSKFIGMPLRKEIQAICGDNSSKSEVTANIAKEAAREHFGLDPKTVTLLVTGGSLGARKINQTIEDSRNVFSAAGIQVIHIVGGKSEFDEVSEVDYKRIKYCDRMELAIAACDLAVSRAGASTVSEFAAVGLPGIYVPYPVGNGEQKLNVKDLVSAGGGVMVLDADFTPEFVSEKLVPLISNTGELARMSKAAKANGISDGTERLLKLVQGVL
jgi:UDP-N-acetylglucosamine--N-acetylmuramyl-(pentapeptide) pyrophosphoryl-undecaprenol N-acetylglucosamine transferase